jgi:hypothetical protein
MRAKAKFRVGQVLWVRTENRFFKVASRGLQGRWYYWEDSKSIGYGEKELRPLTKRERGGSHA